MRSSVDAFESAPMALEAFGSDSVERISIIMTLGLE
jgi:hypothetical protein